MRDLSKILVVSEIFWPRGGGAEYATYLFIKLFKLLGHEVRVVTGTREPCLINGVRFYVSSLLGNFNRVKRFMYVSMLSRQEWFKKLVKWCDILYIPLYSYPLIPIVKRLGKRVIVHLHNLVPAYYHGVKYYDEPLDYSMFTELKYGFRHEYYSMKSLYRAILLPTSYTLYMVSKKWIREADTVITPVSKHARILLKRRALPPKKIRVVYNPLPEIPGYLKPSIGSGVVYAGGSSLLKGLPIALKTFIELCRRRFFPKTMFIGLKEADIEKLKHLTNLYKNLRVYGRLSREKVLAFINDSMTLLYPSIVEEPSPYTIVESVLLNTIPLPFKLGGVKEIIEPICRKYCIELHGDYISRLVDMVIEIHSLSNNEFLGLIDETKEYVLNIMSWDKVMGVLNKIF